MWISSIFGKIKSFKGLFCNTCALHTDTHGCNNNMEETWGFCRKLLLSGSCISFCTVCASYCSVDDFIYAANTGETSKGSPSSDWSDWSQCDNRSRATKWTDVDIVSTSNQVVGHALRSSWHLPDAQRTPLGSGLVWTPVTHCRVCAPIRRSAAACQHAAGLWEAACSAQAELQTQEAHGHRARRVRRQKAVAVRVEEAAGTRTPARTQVITVGTKY